MMNSAMAMAASLARGSKQTQEIPPPAAPEQKPPQKVPTSDKEQSSNVLQRLKTKLLGDASVKDGSCAETSPRGRDRRMMARHDIERGGMSSAPGCMVHPYGIGVPREAMRYAPPQARPRLAPPGPSLSDRWDSQHGVSAGAHGRIGDVRSRQGAAKPNRPAAKPDRPAGSEIKIQSLEEWKDCLSEQKTA